MNPFITVLGLSCSINQPNVKSPPPPEGPKKVETEEPTSDDVIDTEEILANPPAPPSSITTANPPPVDVPQPTPTPQNMLPRWDDVNPPVDLPSGTPTAGLALTHDFQVCYKEWFAERSVHPHVRRYGGRILLPDEQSTGTRILCSQAEKTALINKLREGGVLPSETP